MAFGPRSPPTDCSVYVAAGQQWRGVGRLLYERLLPGVGALGYAAVFAAIALPNPPSVGLHEAMGFQPVGIFRQVGFKLGAWRDVGWWQRLMPEPSVPPVEPREWVSEESSGLY